MHASPHAAYSAQEVQQQCTLGLLAAQRQIDMLHAATNQQLAASIAEIQILQEPLCAVGGAIQHGA